MKPDKNDPVFLAWCAGFFDGEGTVGVYPLKGGKYYYYKGVRRLRGTVSEPTLKLQICFYQNHVRPLKLIREMFGGSMYYRASTRVWFLVMAGPRAANCIRSMLPYSVVKTEEMEAALEFAAIRHVKSGSKEQPERQVALAAKLRLLKKKDPSEAAL